MMAKVEPREHDPVRVVGRRGAGPHRLAGLRRRAVAAEQDRIAMYMNYDMVGSPNYIQMVYDADESSSTFLRLRSGRARRRSRTSTSRTTPRSASRTTTPSSPAGATTRRSSSTASRQAACSPAPRSPRPPLQAAIWGGTVGAQLDPCYHAACDTFANFSAHALEVNSDLIAFAQLTFAFSTRVGQRRARVAPCPARRRCRFRLRRARKDVARALSRAEQRSRAAAAPRPDPLYLVANGRELPYVPRSSTVVPTTSSTTSSSFEDPKQLRALGDLTRAQDRRAPRPACGEHDRTRRCSRHAEGNGRSPPEGPREGRPRTRRTHATGACPDREVLRSRRSALRAQERRLPKRSCEPARSRR